MTEVRAVVQTGPRRLELQQFPMPEVGEDDALLRIEACGICGSDYEQYEGEFAARYPVIPGHEPVGRIEAIGPEASRRWGVGEGDLVVVEPAFNCGRCRTCLEGGRCVVAPGSYGYTSTGIAPALWGGYAEFLYLAPGTIVHKVRQDLPPELAALYNPLGAGFAWAQQVPELSVGQTIAILGPGQRGLASVIAAKEAGASRIIVTGLARDEGKLALAREFGADVTIDVEAEDAVSTVRDATDGPGVDVVVDVTAYATDPVVDALDMVRRGGTIVLAGLKGSHKVPEFPSDRIVMRQLTVKGVLGVDYASFEKAIRVIESGRYPLERMLTHQFGLDEAELAIQTLANNPNGDAISIAIRP